ncbi:MAG: choice-of-anchor J domain-containing protein [Cyclobacteriaceae bacterium]
MKDLSASFFIKSLAITACFISMVMSQAAAQEQCGTVELQEERARRYPQLFSTENFEKWLTNERTNRQQRMGNRRLHQNEIITIPIVVHVVHRPGDPIGTASNVSFERIQAQIESLTNDFRRLNEDTVSTPVLFQPVAADTRIEFTLAKQDPEGLPTDGVVRIASTESYDNAIFRLTELSYWPPEDYLNIYVTSLTSNVLGFATFPSSDLPGLDYPSNELGEGVAVGWQFWSTNQDGTAGRTLTHEVGHYFGLRHIWGDGGCGQDDYVDDTPPSDEPNYNCDEGPFFRCGFESMHMNYMDYTADRCMNAFTAGQAERMRIVLESSPRRNTLAQSPGLNEPTNRQLDAGIRSVINPADIICANEDINPAVEIRNYGSAKLSSITIEMKVDNGSVEVKTFPVDMSRLQSNVLTFSPYRNGIAGQHAFSFEIKNINGQQDENDSNDEAEVQTNVLAKGSLPQLLLFEGNSLPAGWTIFNQDNYTTWEIHDAPNSNPSNRAISMQYAEYEFFRGSLDRLYSPAIDMSGYLNASLTFSMAYAMYPSYENDRLRVKVITGCGQGNSTETILFDRRGMDLATAGQSSSFYRPFNQTDWQTYTIDLSPYVGSDFVTIVFEGQNGYGNNLYLDEILINGGVQYDNDLALRKIINPNGSVCEGPNTPVVEIRNTGRNTVNEFSLLYTLNDGSVQEANYSDQALAPGEVREVELPAIDAEPGINRLQVQIQAVNTADENKENDMRVIAFNSSGDRDVAPFRITFDDPGENQWVRLAPDGGEEWELVTPFPEGTSNTVLKAGFYNSPYSELGRKIWFISPLVNLSTSPEPALDFDYSYSGTANASDTLTVMASLDCGPFVPISKRFGDALIENNYTNEEWVPDSSNVNWRHIKVSLSQFTDRKNVQLAIVATNGGGNNLYLDNIAVNATGETGQNLDIAANEFIVYPNPAGPDDVLKIGFNLEERQTVDLVLYDRMGKTIVEKQIPNMLNQVYTVDLDGYPGGLYFIKVKTTSFESTQKVLLVR